MVTRLKAECYGKRDGGNSHVHLGTPRGCSVEFCLCILLTLPEFRRQKDQQFLPETETEEDYFNTLQ